MPQEQQNTFTTQKDTTPLESKWRRFHLALWVFRIIILGKNIWMCLRKKYLQKTDSSPRKRKLQQIPETGKFAT